MAFCFCIRVWKKIQDFNGFSEIIKSHAVVPNQAISILSAAVILAEFLIGLGCAAAAIGVGRIRKWCWVASTLFFVFAFYGAVALVSAADASKATCGCGAQIIPGSGWEPIIVQDFLLVMTLLLSAALSNSNSAIKPSEVATTAVG